MKSGKKYLIAATKGSIFTEDQLKTTLAIIESIMNSQPLYHGQTTRKIDEIDIITPGHFLTGSYLLESRQPDFVNLSLTEGLDKQRQTIASFWSK